MAALDLLTVSDLAPVLAELRAIRALLDRPRLLSIEEAAEFAGVSVSTIRRELRSGAYPCTRIGRQIRIDARHLAPPQGAEVVDLAAAARAR